MKVVLESKFKQFYNLTSNVHMKFSMSQLMISQSQFNNVHKMMVLIAFTCILKPWYSQSDNSSPNPSLQSHFIQENILRDEMATVEESWKRLHFPCWDFISSVLGLSLLFTLFCFLNFYIFLYYSFLYSIHQRWNSDSKRVTMWS